MNAKKHPCNDNLVLLRGDATLMTNDDVMRWLERTADVLHENRVYLTDLDSAIGDADHGINMDRGFNAVRDKFPTMATMDISTQLRTVGSTLVSTVGGAGGPLYGTAYLRAAGVAAGKQELTSADVVAMLEAFLGGIVARGKAQPGEKTMVDALTPATTAAKQALDEHATLAQITSRAAAAAEEGMKATIPMLATKGRASYLGERSIGHQDPGATSSWLILRSLAETCEGK
jgi:phosphoenolpyruvate---glycerone phosphotransferase subunit DhaL